MKVEIRHRCEDFDSYRAARVKSLFNVESGANFALDAELPIADPDWRIGVIVGPSGSGKTSLGARLGRLYAPRWPKAAPIIDAIAPDGHFDQVTGALSAVGLGSVPSWLRPYPVLSNGERFRATLARLVCDAPPRAVVDEFSSVVDRQIAKVGAGAFAKAWRRTGGQVVLLSCHYDILDWLQPDWVFDTGTGHFQRGLLRRRPPLELAVWQTDWRYWPLFEPHHYLKLPRMIAAACYVATIEGEPVAHVAVSTRPGLVEARACRLTADLVPAECDLIVAAHAHAYIAADARAATRLGALGYPPSLLPRHRGRDAVRWAIHMREAVTGGTAYWMDDGADTGPIAAQGWCHIRPDDNPQTLWRRALAPLGIALLKGVLEDLDQGVVTRIPQDPTLASWEPAFNTAKFGA